MIIKKDCLSLYEKNDNEYEKVYFEGNPEYSYSINSAKESVERFLNMLLGEYNLDTMGEIDFVVIDNEDEIVSEVMLGEFAQSVKKRINIMELMSKILDSIGRDKKLHISDYGINYDGKRYIFNNQKIVKEEFSLLAYTLNDNMLINFIEEVM